MQITFLGTGAATSYPLAFCRCEICEQARKKGGKNHRKRSALMINDDLLIDLGPDIMTASLLYQKPVCDIRYYLQTHPHSDHFDPAHLVTRSAEYGGRNIHPMQMFASAATLQEMARKVKEEADEINLLDAVDQKCLNLEVVAVEKYQTFQIGSYSVTTFPANHDDTVDPLMYAVSQGECSILYATDTGQFEVDVWKKFHERNHKFDAVILDHTYGPDTEGEGHLNAGRFIEHLLRFKEEKLISSTARFLATHLSHEGNMEHEVLSKYAASHGYEIAYDGLVITL